MKIMLTKIMMTLSIVSVMMKMPMSMGMTLLTQTFMAILLMNSTTNLSWIPMITFLTMIGGLMIIFMYMSSITSNEKFKMNTKLIMPMIMLMMMTEELMYNFQIQENQNMQNEINPMIPMTKMYNKSMTMTLLMITYLLMTMLAVNKIIKMFEGPLRSKTYE